jgi:hypothetical protein
MPGAHHRGWIPPVRGCDAAAQPGNGTLSRYSDRQRSGNNLLNKHNQVSTTKYGWIYIKQTQNDNLTSDPPSSKYRIVLVRNRDSNANLKSLSRGVSDLPNDADLC